MSERSLVAILNFLPKIILFGNVIYALINQRKRDRSNVRNLPKISKLSHLIFFYFEPRKTVFCCCHHASCSFLNKHDLDENTSFTKMKSQIDHENMLLSDRPNRLIGYTFSFIELAF